MNTSNAADGASFNESQRDSATKPRVARNELPWVTAINNTQPQRGCGCVRMGLHAIRKFAAVAVLVLGVTVLPHSYAADTADEIRDLKKQIDALDQKVR